MKFRTAYQDDYDSSDYFTELSSEGAAQQQFKDECDVNKILEKYLRTGSIEHVERRAAVYADFSSLPGDYREAVEIVSAAEEAFDSLPAQLRARFKHDPGEFISWMSSDIDVDEKRSLGLLKSAPESVPIVVEEEKEQEGN